MRLPAVMLKIVHARTILWGGVATMVATVAPQRPSRFHLIVTL